MYGACGSSAKLHQSQDDWKDGVCNQIWLSNRLNKRALLYEELRIQVHDLVVRVEIDIYYKLPLLAFKNSNHSSIKMAGGALEDSAFV